MKYLTPGLRVAIPAVIGTALLTSMLGAPAEAATRSGQPQATSTYPASRAPVRTLVSTDQADARINTKLAKRIGDARFGSDFSVVVLDAATQQVVFSRRGDAAMLSASNMKIITAVNTVATVGPDTRFRTSVFAGANPGDITIQGGGDPMLTTADLKSLAKTTAASLDPDTPVVVSTDLNLFPAASLAPGWPRGYVPSSASPVTALARLGDYSVNPTERAVSVFIAKLRSLGFATRRGTEVDVPASTTPIAGSSRHTAGDAIRLMLNVSENNIAENLFRHVALAAGLPATWRGARTAAESTLAALGIDTTGLALMDGSGLSRTNRVSALALANVVRLSTAGDKARFAVLYARNSMPTSGTSGTLDDTFGRYTTNPSRCAQGVVRAKTGTLSDTIGLSGVTIGADGQKKVFSILVNHRPQRFSALSIRQAADGLAATITGCW